MNAGKKYSLFEFIVWAKHHLLFLFCISFVVTVLYYLGCTFLSISWLPISMLGTAVAFIVGFKNNASYGRLWEARQIYGAIINDSRSFGVKVRDFLGGKHSEEVQKIIYRHFAWLTALRYQLREPRVWENMEKRNNKKYAEKYFVVAEKTIPITDELQKYLDEKELNYLLSKKNRATQALAMQSEHLNQLYKEGRISEFQQLQLQNSISSFYDQQGKAERIKNFPYPRNFSSVANILLYVFVLLVPFGLLKEFNNLGDGTILQGYTIWLNVPFATLLTWVFVSLDEVGESSMNPFEGNANDVPITQISRTIEIDLRDMLDEENLPQPITPTHNIVL